MWRDNGRRTSGGLDDARDTEAGDAGSSPALPQTSFSFPILALLRWKGKVTAESEGPGLLPFGEEGQGSSN